MLNTQQIILFLSSLCDSSDVMNHLLHCYLLITSSKSKDNWNIHYIRASLTKMALHL